MILAIIGSRNFTDEKLLDKTLLRYFHTYEDNSEVCGYIPDFDEVVSGGAVGSDSLAANWVKDHNEGFDELSPGTPIKLTEFLPDWSTYGKAAGPIRNRLIIERADVVLAFWCGQSPGTRSSLSIAKELKKTTMIVYF